MLAKCLQEKLDFINVYKPIPIQIQLLQRLNHLLPIEMCRQIQQCHAQSVQMDGIYRLGVKHLQQSVDLFRAQRKAQCGDKGLKERSGDQEGRVQFGLVLLGEGGVDQRFELGEQDFLSGV
ncbi:hypothetical protein FGO68_gene3276 [Halteria grandinella]|uniref:Uncharacterized protein n=1 Tax=Halteria grandinella TaxID=5974 RepID=A0A8J8T1P0_HALGN|nr:hypothetical protein FGO68_gene3276 [Halteria grandinella]